MTRRVILHIGAPKTGTTTIQAALYRHHDLLEAQGFCYPHAYTQWQGHHPLARTLIGIAHDPVDVSSVVSRYAAEAGDRTLLLSSEDLSRLTKPSVDRLVEDLRNHFDSIEVISYARHPVEWLRSGYKWHMTRGSDRFTSFQAYLDHHDLPRHLDYMRPVRAWTAADQITYRVFRGDVLRDFTNVTGMEIPSPPASSNASHSDLAVRVAGAMVPWQGNDVTFRKKVNEHLLELVGKRDVNLVDQETYYAIQECARPSIRNLLEALKVENGQSLLARNWSKPTLTDAEALEASLEAVALALKD